MIFYYVILLFLSWPQTRGTKTDVDVKGEEIFDQFATASENVAHVVIKQSNAENSKNLREHPMSVPSPINATVHYANSNGFVPMASSVPSLYDDEPDPSSLSQTDDPARQNPNGSEVSNTTNAVSASQDSSFDAKAKNFEEDLAYSSEARIFLSSPGSLTNRRSFDFQESRANEFELLKVNNDTPAVANYQEFYENVRSTVNTETDSETDASSMGRLLNGKRGKNIENHAQYDRQQRINDEDLYAQYYAQYNGAQDAKKTAYEQEKVAGNYHQQNTANYDGHGQSGTTGQNAATVSSSSRTNYHQVNELAHRGTYDGAAESLKTRQRFSKPVVVAEPSDYKIETQLNSQRNSGTDNDYKTLRNLKSAGSETSIRYEIYGDNSRQRSYHRTEDSGSSSDESSDYTEYIERPRGRTQKGRRRPAYSDPSKKLPKEHRGTLDGGTEENKHKFASPKLKSQRYRVKANPWANDPSANHSDESVEDVGHVRGGNTETKGSTIQHVPHLKNSNIWNQVSPNLEVSHSNGIELDQVEKPKFVVPVKVNLVPVTNFDHATALGNSQGFDVSNAVLQNFATVAPIGPLLSTPQSVLAQNLALSKNLQNLAVPTPVPDIIVGQNTFHNPVHTVLFSPPGDQHKIADTLRATYLPSTITPVFALTSSLSPMLQGMQIQDNVTPRTAFAVTPSPTSVMQHMPINQMQPGMQQLLVPQPTIQTFSSFLQTPLQTTQIQVNPHGLQGQNLISHGNLQMHNLPTTHTLLSGQTMPEGRANLISADLQNKKSPYAPSDANFLASANLAVGQNEQKQATNVNSYYLPNHNTQAAKPHGVYQVIKDIDMTPKTKTFLQATQVVPTVLQPSTTLSGINQQYIKLQANDVNNDAVQQLQAQINKQLIKNNRMPGVVLQSADSAASHSNTVSAHLPNVGMRNVEIVNPNIKPSQIDMNAYQTMHYPAVLTTPIPIFNTIAPITPQTVSLQNYVDSLTETGARGKQLLDLKPSQNQERPMFNPINFVPNVDVIKNQNSLNNKLPTNEPVQQGLNLVPVMPGGNFFKPSYAAQNELVMKPKLASDLQKYAEEMFKESLKTMYNSHKWNNDRRPQGYGQNYSEVSDLAKLRAELQKLRASLTESKHKDLLEAHQSETSVRATDPSASGKKKPDPLLATVEHLLKTRPSGPIHIYHGVKPNRKRKPGDSSFHDESDDDTHLTEFLTPPRHNFHSTAPYHDKPKKRPGSRFKNGPRKPAKLNRSPFRPSGPETSASNVDVYLDGPHYHGPPPMFDSENFDYDPRQESSSYSTFTTPSSKILGKILRELRTERTSNKNYDINHPRMHNLLGLLMKNKQLPMGSPQSYFREKNQVRQFFEDENRLRQPFYDDAGRDYIDRTDVAMRSGSIANGKVYPGNGIA